MKETLIETPLEGGATVRIVNLSERLGRGGNAGRTVFRIDGRDVKVPLPRDLVRQGRAPYVTDNVYARRVGRTSIVVSPIVQVYGRAGASISGGDGGLRDYDRLSVEEKVILADLLGEEAAAAARDAKTTGKARGERAHNA